jgi:hypothetical protein
MILFLIKDISFLENLKYSNIYYKNDEFHSLKYPAYNLENQDFYYINGRNFSYDEWLVHPEKVRFDRFEKLENL